MRLRHFVTAVSLILMGWLSVSYFHEMPVKRAAPVPSVTAAGGTGDGPTAAGLEDEGGELAVSVSP